MRVPSIGGNNDASQGNYPEIIFDNFFGQVHSTLFLLENFIGGREQKEGGRAKLELYNMFSRPESLQNTKTSAVYDH